ncbi:MAG: PqqD family protein [Dehalococcoidales bacterium]|nr:PqqD family protein [Dehalococcoidales bacterium]
MSNYAAQKEDLIWRRIGDEVVIITSDGLSTHILNKTAARIWELCDGSHDVPDIADSLCQQFEVLTDQARTDVVHVIEQLLHLGLIKEMAGA